MMRRDDSAERRYERYHVETFDPTEVLERIRALPARRQVHGRAARRLPPLHGEHGRAGTSTTPARWSSTSCSTTAPTRVVVASPEHGLEEFFDLVDRMGLHHVSYAIGWTAWLDIAPEGVNKATGARARARLARPPERSGPRHRRRPQRPRDVRLGGGGGPFDRHGAGARRGAAGRPRDRRVHRRGRTRGSSRLAAVATRCPEVSAHSKRAPVGSPKAGGSVTGHAGNDIWVDAVSAPRHGRMPRTAPCASYVKFVASVIAVLAVSAAGIAAYAAIDLVGSLKPPTRGRERVDTRGRARHRGNGGRSQLPGRRQ